MELEKEIIVSKIPLQFQGVENPNVFEYSVDGAVYALDWFEDSLAYGHDHGVTILSRTFDPINSSGLPSEFQRQWSFRKSYQYLGQAADFIRFRGDYIAAAHNADYSISLIHLETGEVTSLTGGSGHASFINGIDISDDGLVVSTGDDRNLVIWENGKPIRTFRLTSPGLDVRFWDGGDSDLLAVLEAGNKIRILDWQKGQWLLTIYPGGAFKEGETVKSIGVVQGEVVAIANMSCKRFRIRTLSGGCGYTPASDELKPSSDYKNWSVAYSQTNYVAYVSSNDIYFYDLHRSDEHGLYINYGVDDITCTALRSRGDVLAIASGNTITFLHNTYMNYDDNSGDTVLYNNSIDMQ